MTLAEYFSPDKRPSLGEGTKFLISGNVCVLAQVEAGIFTIINIQHQANRWAKGVSVQDRHFSQKVMQSLLPSEDLTQIKIISNQEAHKALERSWL